MKFSLAFAAALVGVVSANVCEDLPEKPNFRSEEATSRWMLHTADYGFLTTTSTLEGLEGTSFGNPYSFVDGSCANSTGTAYFYASGMDQSMIDIEANPAVSFALTEATFNNDPRLEQKACVVGSSGDPENPPCARSVMSGTFRKLVDDSEEFSMIKDAFFERHPSMADWPTDHSWFIGAIDISNIWLIDIYGGAKTLDLDKYYGVSL